VDRQVDEVGQLRDPRLQQIFQTQSVILGLLSLLGVAGGSPQLDVFSGGLMDDRDLK
jgi:hypothetical protein